MLLLLKPMHLEPVLPSKRSQCNKKPLYCNEVSPGLYNERKLVQSNKDPAQSKINKYIFKRAGVGGVKKKMKKKKKKKS